jgi:two-component system NtrC family response regulator
MADILIIDDDKDMAFTLCKMVEHMGHTYAAAFTLKDGLQKASACEFDVVFLDVRLPDGNGLDIIPQLQKSVIPPEIIIITAYGDPGGAELALKSGVWDYLTKPLSMDDLRLALGRAHQYRQQKKRCATPVAVHRSGIIGDSPRMSHCIDKLAQAAGMDAGILITGETGTGKELFARAIHANSARAGRHFVAVDCTALPDQLVESILFGYVKGAFTGANEAQDGLIREADGGTLFLDEIGELAFDLQKTFLRVLQEHRFRPVGMRKEIQSDFRVIAATNQDLDAMIGKGLFRKDLLFRLRALVIDLPPLRERTEDIKELILYHAARLCDRYGIGPKGFSPECLEILKNYSWPGNVRELVNTLENAVTAARMEPMLYAKHLPLELRITIKSIALEQAQTKANDKAVRQEGAGRLPKLDDYITSAKCQYLKNLMRQAQGDIRRACAASGLSKSTLYDLLKKHRIPRFE